MTQHGSPRARSRRARLGAGIVAVAAVAATSLALTPAANAAQADDTDAPKTVVYVEVNGNDFANVADYTLAGTDRPTFDMAAIFAANINADGDRAVLHLNERVTWTLEHADTQIRPVQARGTKVLLSVLGNHQGLGFANFPSPEAADDFAAQLEDAVDTYGLDGIDFDDEWTEYGVNGTPQPNADSFGWLLQSLRERLGPDKLITLYDIGPSSTVTDWTKVDAGALIDYAWNPYYGSYSAPRIPGFDRQQLGAGAVDLQQQSASTAKSFAERTAADGYGVLVTYNLTDVDQSAYLSNITRVFHGLDTAYRAAPADTTAPLIAVKQGARYTATHGGDGSYNKVTFDLSDDTGLATATVNGVATDLRGATGRTLGIFKPGSGGAVRGANTLVVTDVAGNTTTLEFVLR